MLLAYIYPQMDGVSLIETHRLLKLVVGNKEDFDHGYEDVPDASDNDQNIININGVAVLLQGRTLDRCGLQNVNVWCLKHFAYVTSFEINRNLIT